MSGVALPERDRRALLWLCCAAICWRWLVGVQAPLPGVDACRDLWLAERLVALDFAELGQRWWRPTYALLLWPVLACGAAPFAAAQVLASLLGGLAIVPVALAAERLREGAGVPAGVLSMVAAGPVVAAGAGSATSWLTLLVGCALWAYAARRLVLAMLLALVVAAAGTEQVAGHARTGFDALRLGLGALLLPLPLLWLPPRSPRFIVPVLALLAVVAVAVLDNCWTQLLPTWSPMVVLLGGIALARLPLRWRDVCLCLVVGAQCHAAWTLGEAREAVAERVVGAWLTRHQQVPIATTLPRVQWAAGQRPAAASGGLSLRSVLAQASAASVVLEAAEARDATLRAELAARYVRADLPPDLVDLAEEYGLGVLFRR